MRILACLCFCILLHANPITMREYTELCHFIRDLGYETTSITFLQLKNGELETDVAKMHNLRERLDDNFGEALAHLSLKHEKFKPLMKGIDLDKAGFCYNAGIHTFINRLKKSELKESLLGYYPFLVWDSFSDEEPKPPFDI